jgi:chaperonin cofactor prefoldin
LIEEVMEEIVKEKGKVFRKVELEDVSGMIANLKTRMKEGELKVAQIQQQLAQIDTQIKKLESL